MPYREPAPPSEKTRTIVYGPFRRAQVRLAIAAVLTVAVAGSLAQWLRRARLSCSRESQRCELRILELRRFAVTTIDFPIEEIVDTMVGTSWRFGDSDKTYTPELRLTTGAVPLFEVDEATSDRLLAAIGEFVQDRDRATLSVDFDGCAANVTLKLLFLCPIWIIFWISTLRGGGGALRMTVEGNQLTVPRRRRLRRADHYAVGEIRGVDVDRKRLKGRLTLLMKDGHDRFVTDRALTATRADAHDRAAHELRIALGVPVMPDLPEGDPNRELRRSPGLAFFGALGGVFLGAGLAAACDLWRAVGGKPSVTMLAICLAAGAMVGLAMGLRRR